MQKLIVTCECGQRMQVPRSAIGRTGMCPTCGRTMAISADNSSPATSSQQRGRFFSAKTSWWRGGAAAVSPTDDAKRKFGQAVDLYYARHYAEALAIFDDLLRRYPGNADIESGRRECLASLRRPQQTLALEDKGASSFGNAGEELNETTIRRIVLHKMLHGSTDAVQLQAAEIACKLLGLFDADRHEKRTRPGDRDPLAHPQTGNGGNGRADRDHHDDGNGAAALSQENDSDGALQEREPLDRTAPET
ncbi:MAG TPA: hypothetical protein PLO62_15350 [Candidatus Hydrogenedentes bacterium]|nr:hypothetical protein [Candidatus Hydrogenedentota bacterium]